jgi:tetratricopeptide (TPR) repeat protein
MPPYAKHASLRLLLAQARYDELEAALEQFRAAALWDFENGENRLSQAFRAFNVSETDVSAQIDEWIETRPKSYQAHLARAYCDLTMALDARGEKFARETSEEQFRVMRRYLDKAEEEARASIELQPRNVAAYRVLVVIARYSGRRFGQLTDEALRAFPASMVLRVNTMDSLQPKWHGNVELMEQFAQKSQEYAGQNRNLRALLGYPDWGRGEVLRLDKRYDEAIEMYTKAIGIGGEQAEFLIGRSLAARRSHRYDLAISDGRRALELHPWLAELEDTQLNQALKAARRYVDEQHQQGNLGRAIDVLTALIEHDPKDKEALAFRGEDLCATGKGEAGIVDIEQALALDPDYGHALAGMASCFIASGKYLEGIKRLEARLLKAPGNQTLRSELIRLYAGQGDVNSLVAAHGLLCHQEYGNSCSRFERLLQAVRAERPHLADALAATKRAPHPVERLATVEDYEAYMRELEESGEFKGKPGRVAFVSRVSPTFPGWAMKEVSGGKVEARLFVRADGSVAGVRILSAHPAGYFELAAMTALLQWKLQPSDQGFVAAQILNFEMAPQPAAGAKKKK